MKHNPPLTHGLRGCWCLPELQVLSQKNPKIEQRGFLFLERLHLGTHFGVRVGPDECLQLHHAGHSSPCCCPPPALAEQFSGFAIDNLQPGGEDKGRALSKAQQVVKRVRKRCRNCLGE